jgi:hypothetical protein
MMETLVVLKQAGSAAALAELRGRFRVRSALPPRIVELEGDADLSALQAMPQVEAVLTGEADPVPASLNAPESTFVRAWQARRKPAEKQRRGEGLPWDAEGFLPPDPPKNT